MKHKVIKISGCHQCPYETMQEICCYPASKFKDTVTGDELKFHYENKSLPENCPLEIDVLHEMTKKKIWELWKMVSNT